MLCCGTARTFEYTHGKTVALRLVALLQVVPVCACVCCVYMCVCVCVQRVLVAGDAYKVLLILVHVYLSVFLCWKSMCPMSFAKWI